MVTDNNEAAYRTLTDIRARKEALKKDITEDDAKIKALWSSLFHKPDYMRRDATPSKKLSGLMNVGAGVFDGIMLGWKLYRKFKRR